MQSCLSVTTDKSMNLMGRSGIGHTEWETRDHKPGGSIVGCPTISLSYFYPLSLHLLSHFSYCYYPLYLLYFFLGPCPKANVPINKKGGSIIYVMMQLVYIVSVIRFNKRNKKNYLHYTINRAKIGLNCVWWEERFKWA